RRPSPAASKFPPQVTTIKAPKVNAVKGVQENWEIQVSYGLGLKETLTFLFLVQEINGGYVAFGGNPKGGKSQVKVKSGQCLFTAARPVTTAVPQPHVTSPKPAKTVVTKPYSPPRRTINRRPSPAASKFPPQVTTVKAPKVNVVKGVQGNWGNLQHALKDKGVIDSRCSRHMIRNMSYLTEFEEINGGYVAFGGNPKGGKILDIECIVLSLEFKLPDENQVLLRVPKENNMYNVDLKNIVPSGDSTCLFEKETLDEVLVTKPHNKTPYELLLGRTPSIGFMRPFGCPMTILNTLNPLGKFNGKADEGFLVGYSNTNGDATFEVKEPEFEGRKPEYEVHVSPSSSTKTKKHEVEDFFDNNINEVNAASTPVPTVGQISINSTNTFSVVGPANTAVSPTLRESSYVGPSQYLDDPNMPALEDITYSDDEEDVANQTRSMTRMVKDQGGLTQINNEDFHTYMFAYFLSQEEPKRVHQSLKDPSWIEAMQEELLQFKMQKVWVLVDFPNGKRAICTKWVFGNKKDERGIVVKNKA
nr:putative polyprotein [Tanacetum cinerariifolium]